MNIRKSLPAWVILGAFCAPYTSRAIIVIEEKPSVMITVKTGDQPVENIPVELISADKGWTFSIDLTTSEYQIQGSGTLDPDPSIAYGLAVTDFGAPSSFGFLFSTPIVPTGPLTTVESSLAGALTDFTGDGISMTPTGATMQTSTVGLPTVSMGVDVGPAFAAAAGLPGALHVYGPHTAGPMAGPSGIFTVLTVGNSFTFSGGGDIAALTGFARVDTASVPDMGPGLAGLLSIGGALLFGGRSFKCSRMVS